MKAQFFTGMLIGSLALATTTVFADDVSGQMSGTSGMSGQQPQSTSMPMDNNQNAAVQSQGDNSVVSPSMPTDGSNATAMPAAPSQPAQPSQNSY